MTKIILDQVCYSHYLWFLSTYAKHFQYWQLKINLLSGPDYNCEGMNGYVECRIEITCAQSVLGLIGTAWDQFYSLPQDERIKYYIT